MRKKEKIFKIKNIKKLFLKINKNHLDSSIHIYGKCKRQADSISAKG